MKFNILRKKKIRKGKIKTVSRIVRNKIDLYMFEGCKKSIVQRILDGHADEYKNQPKFAYYIGEYYRQVECDYEKGLEYLEIACKHTNSHYAYHKTGICFKKIGKYKKALEYYAEALKRKNSRIFMYNIGASYKAMGDYEEAFYWFMRSHEYGYKDAHNAINKILPKLTEKFLREGGMTEKMSVKMMSLYNKHILTEPIYTHMDYLSITL